jgi:hypothetical protein
MKAIWNGQTIAESDDIVTVEGNAYFPEVALNHEFVRPSQHTSICPWKGTAHYYSLMIDGQTNANAVWYLSGAEAGGRQHPRPRGFLERRAGQRLTASRDGGEARCHICRYYIAEVVESSTLYCPAPDHAECIA